MSRREASAAVLVDKKELIGKKPIKTISVPSELRRPTNIAERDILTSELKIRWQCDLVVHWDNGRIRQFDIYGSAADATNATGFLNRWVSNAHLKSKDSSSWAKTSAFNADKWYYDQLDLMERDRKEVFKGPAPQSLENGDPLPHITVDWPEDLQIHHVTPRDTFGNKLEGLNELRMRDEVFITLLPFKGDLWKVEISGFAASNIEKAKEHYDTLIEKVRMAEFGVKTSVTIILDDEEGLNITFYRTKGLGPKTNDRVVPRLVASPMVFSAGSFRERGLQPTDLSAIQQAIHQSLEAIRAQKGSFDFVVRLGYLALRSEKMSNDQVGKTISKAEFRASIDSDVDLITKKGVFNTELGSEILRRFMTDNELLEPTTSAASYSSPPATLEETRPVYRGTWVFSDPDKSPEPSAPPIRHPGRPAPLQKKPATPAPSLPRTLWVVQVDFTHDEDAKPEMIGQQFYKLEPNMVTPRAHMDVKLLELGVSRGWKFALESMSKVPKRLTPPILTKFASSVTMNPNYDPNSLEIFARWNTTPTVVRYLKYGRLEKIYSFGFKGTCYKAELTAMWVPGQGRPVWGLGVRHSEWATLLGGLESLPVGGKLKWGNPTSTFLPDDGFYHVGEEDEAEMTEMMGDMTLDSQATIPPRNGIRILTKCLMQVSEVVVSVSAAQGGKL